MTINERVSPERLAHIRASYEASRKGYAFIGHPSYNESIAIIDELQQYRADAEPARNPVLGYADSYRDMAKRGVESVPIWSVITDLERNIAPLFAAPQVTSVPEEATPESIEVLASVRPPHGVAFQLDGYDRKLASDIWNACRGAMLTDEGESAAPAVPAEQLSGNTEQVSQPYTLPLDYLQGYKDGCEWSALMAEANHPQTGDWLFDDPIELAKAIRKGPDMLPAAPKQEAE